jgi:hypothetical protein
MIVPAAPCCRLCCAGRGVGSDDGVWAVVGGALAHANLVHHPRHRAHHLGRHAPQQQPQHAACHAAHMHTQAAAAWSTVSSGHGLVCHDGAKDSVPAYSAPRRAAAAPSAAPGCCPCPCCCCCVAVAARLAAYAAAASSSSPLEQRVRGGQVVHEGALVRPAQPHKPHALRQRRRQRRRRQLSPPTPTGTPTPCHRRCPLLLASRSMACTCLLKMLRHELHGIYK